MYETKINSLRCNQCWQFFAHKIVEINPRLSELSKQIEIVKAKIKENLDLYEKYYDHLINDGTWKNEAPRPDYKKIRGNLATIGIDLDIYRSPINYHKARIELWKSMHSSENQK